MTPFEILDTDIDRFFMMCNYLCNLGAQNAQQTSTTDEREEAADFWAAI